MTVHVPTPHANFVDRAVEVLARDERIVAVAAGGSYATGTMDEHSDLDLVIAVEPDAYTTVLDERQTIAATLGSLLAAFTGEHVGEPQLLICLYKAPLLHVDLEFLALPDVSRRSAPRVALWERAERLTSALDREPVRPLQPDQQWIEDRFWVWVHYGAVKIARGELFEALDFLAFLRSRVLGPLALAHHGAPPYGVRHVETRTGAFARAMQSTVATYDARACADALLAATDLYLDLRGRDGGVTPNDPAREAALAFAREIQSSLA